MFTITINYKKDDAFHSYIENDEVHLLKLLDNTEKAQSYFNNHLKTWKNKTYLFHRDLNKTQKTNKAVLSCNKAIPVGIYEKYLDYFLTNFQYVNNEEFVNVSNIYSQNFVHFCKNNHCLTLFDLMFTYGLDFQDILIQQTNSPHDDSTISFGEMIFSLLPPKHFLELFFDNILVNHQNKVINFFNTKFLPSTHPESTTQLYQELKQYCLSKIEKTNLIQSLNTLENSNQTEFLIKQL